MKKYLGRVIKLKENWLKCHYVLSLDSKIAGIIFLLFPFFFSKLNKIKTF